MAEMDVLVEVDETGENAEVKKSIEEDMDLVEKSISEIVGALGDEPENEVLVKMLVSTYRRQMKLMKTFLLLDDEE